MTQRSLLSLALALLLVLSTIRLSRKLLLCVLLALLVCPIVAQTSGTAGPRNVLVLYDEPNELPGLAILDRSLRSALTSGSSVKIDVYSETLDLSRFQDESYYLFLRDYFRQKYSRKKMDVVIAAMDPSLDFLLAYGEEIFPGTPIVFCGVGGQETESRRLGVNVTGVLVKREFKSTLDVALRLQPDTQRVVFIVGTSRFDKHLAEQALRELREYEGQLVFTYLTDLPLNDLLREVSALPPHTIILFSTLFRDGAGEAFVPHDVVALISQKANAPVYGFVDQYLGRGIVGGHLYSLEAHGNKTAEIVLRVLGGENVADIPIVEGTANVDIFDWRELQRWGISEKSLPPGSILRFRVPTFWEQYKWYAIGGLSVIILQLALIVGLVINHGLRKRAETERVRAQAEVAESQLRLAGVIGSAMDAIITVDEQQRITLFNDSAEKIFHCPAAEAIGQPLNRFTPERFRAAHKNHIEGLGRVQETNRSMDSRGPIFGRRADGKEFPIEASISQLESGGHKFYTLILRDISERQQALENLRESEERFRNLANTAPVLIWVNGVEGCEFVNRSYLDFLGVSDVDVRHYDWARFVHPDDRDGYVKAYLDATAMQGQFEAQFRFLRADGEYRWMKSVALPRLTSTGDFLGYVGSTFDITDMKQAEEAIRESEERFRNMADTAPVMIWVSGPDKLYTYFNKQWLDFTGRALAEELGLGWSDGVHADDFDRCLQTYHSAFDRREPFTMEYRLRRADGEYRWVYNSGTPRLSAAGEFLGYIGSSIDITERKAAEQSLMELSGKLIQAREDERARIARELHDDLSQSVALMSLELDQLRQSAPASAEDWRATVQAIMQQSNDLSIEIHRMSRALHPSKLAHLGLVAALRSLCVDLSHSYELNIKFTHAEVPADLPKEVSLCLYRIVQESLNNVVRHSGAREALVDLRCSEQEIRLRVADRGNGFDMESGGSKKGLGLLSMRERMRLVGGAISIDSRQGQGTRVEVRVPLGRAGVRADGGELSDMGWARGNG